MTRVDLYVVVFRLRLMMGTYAMPKELVLTNNKGVTKVCVISD